jgi:hypothetical protein
MNADRQPELMSSSTQAVKSRKLADIRSKELIAQPHLYRGV